MIMPLIRKKFDPNHAYSSHWGTILAADVVPEGFKAPFSHAYGYLLETGKTMGGHAHAFEEIYIVLSGSGYVIQGGNNKAVKAGDVITVPANIWHTMLCTDKDEAPFLWAALWWDSAEGLESTWKPEDGICVRRFDKETAIPAHEGSILAAPVLPEVSKAPFGDSYGYLTPGKGMCPDCHPAEEMYVVFNGTGTMTVDGETEKIGPGDVIAIPSNATHTIAADSDSDLLYAAFWWESIPD